MKKKIYSKKIKNSNFRPVFLIIAFLIFCSHNLYLKMDTYFLKPNQKATLSLYNGTYENSENIITRDRMLDASVVAQGKRVAIDSSQWIDVDSTITQISFNTGKSGTYVAGVSTKARTIELEAEKFNEYLKHDGVLDALEQRTKDSLLDQDVVESYQKHVKAIYQVGTTKTEDWKTVLGYPIELVPLANPYDKYTGDELEIQLLLDGEPLANQLIYADYIKVEHDHDHGDNEHSHDHSHDHKHNGEAHTHDHNHKHGDSHKHDHDGHDHKHGDGHKHDHKHDGKSHAHEHEHDGEAHTHDHKHKDGDHHEDDHDHEHEDGKHHHKHGGKTHSHDHEHKDGDGHKHDHDSHDHKHGDGHKHDHAAESHNHDHHNGQQLRSNSEGIVSVKLPEDGLYYLRTIYMQTATDSEKLTHQSKWATLTFEVTHKHDEGTHTHEHEHDEGLPDWAFVVISFLIIGLLFVVFRKK